MSAQADEQSTAGAGSFPRPVFDEMGQYTVTAPGRYEVDSELVAKVAVADWAYRDLWEAHDMICEYNLRQANQDSFRVLYGLWVGAVVLYAKSFTRRNDARKGLNEFLRNALSEQFSDDDRALHDYTMYVRNEALAHDDGLAECKKLVLALPMKPPSCGPEIGVGSGVTRAILPASDVAQRLEEHFGRVRRSAEQLWQQLHSHAGWEFFKTHFEGVTLLGIYQQKKVSLNVEEVLGRFRPPGKTR